MRGIIGWRIEIVTGEEIMYVSLWEDGHSSIREVLRPIAGGPADASAPPADRLLAASRYAADLAGIAEKARLARDVIIRDSLAAGISVGVISEITGIYRIKDSTR